MPRCASVLLVLHFPAPCFASDAASSIVLRSEFSVAQVRKAAVGFRAHSGWAAMVAVCVEKGAPRVLARERVQLVETFTYRFRQPYHTAEKLPLAEAREFVAGVEKESQELAFRAIRGLPAELQKQGIELRRCALLLASGKTLPSFEKILASHPLIHTADGVLFRAAFSHAAKRCGLEA